jgi:hypothetical protein
MVDTGQDDMANAKLPAQMNYTSTNQTNQTPHSGIPPASCKIRQSIHPEMVHPGNTRGGGQNGGQARGRSDHPGRGGGCRRTQINPTTTTNLHINTTTQPPTPFTLPTGPKYNFNKNPIITPWENLTNHNTTSKIQWGITNTLGRANTRSLNQTINTGNTKHSVQPNYNTNEENKSILCDTKGARSKTNMSYNGVCTSYAKCIHGVGNKLLLHQATAARMNN